MQPHRIVVVLGMALACLMSVAACHGDHIHVAVTTSDVPDELILVKEDGALLLAPDPRKFE